MILALMRKRQEDLEFMARHSKTLSENNDDGGGDYNDDSPDLTGIL